MSTPQPSQAVPSPHNPNPNPNGPGRSDRLLLTTPQHPNSCMRTQMTSYAEQQKAELTKRLTSVADEARVALERNNTVGGWEGISFVLWGAGSPERR